MELLTTLILPAITETVFGSLAEAVGLSDWLRDRLKRDPEKLAFQHALTQALTDAAKEFPGRDLHYFAEVLRDVGGALLARTLLPAATLPTADELTHLWLNHLTIDSKIHYRQEFERFATLLLERLIYHIENQQALQWIVQARRERNSEEAMRRAAAANEQSAANLEALRHEIAELNKSLENTLNNRQSTIVTEGGAYIGGGVNAHNFAGRDLTIKSYFIQGLPRLVIDYSSRIQDFLFEYLGSKRKRVPFGGRQQQLDELHRWLDDPAAPPYYLMSAEAGRGKSALVCRWLAQLTSRSDLDLIFVPISIRFETATQDVVFAALAARLANLYESEPEKLPPASLTAEQWKGVCQSYLRREPPAGKKLLVILDGLDEATGWIPARSLFSSDPPEGLRVLVTARTRPGESGANGWATTLGWEDGQLARTATLVALERRGVEEALLSMGNPLDTLATKVDVVGELHRLSEGDPLLVRLYVDALVAEKERVATLQAEDLRNIKPGLAGYFERWWQDQQEQWRIQGRDPIVEQANLRTLLNAIAAAMGPLTLDDLAALHPDLADSMLVRRLIQQVSRWLVGNGKAQGYSYSHPRLGYYFWEQLGAHEQKTWDDRFVGWGTRVLAELNAESLVPERAPRYLLHHYAVHLERADAPAEKLYALISNGWRKAWEVQDVSFGGFLGDVDRACERAKEPYDPTRTGRALALVQQIKAGLCQASIAALGNNMPPELLAQALQAGLRTPVQALAIAKLVPSDEKREKILSALILYLPIELLSETLAVVYSLQNEHLRAKVLLSIVPHLPIELLGEVLDIARSIRSFYILTDVLLSLVPHLSIELLDDALAIARSINVEHLRVEALICLAKHSSISLLDEALAVALSIQYGPLYVRTLARLVSYLPNERRLPIVSEVLRSAGLIQDTSSRADALICLVPYLPDEQRQDVLIDILNSVRFIEHESSRTKALGNIVQYLPSELLNEALKIASLIINAPSRCKALNGIALYLPSDSLGEILRVACSIQADSYYSAEALSNLVPCLPAEQRRDVLGKALHDVFSIKHEFSRAKALICLAPHLPIDLLDETLRASYSIEYESFRADVLIGLAPHLPAKLLDVTLKVARSIQSEYIYASCLSILIPHLTAEQRHNVLDEALKATHSIQSKKKHASILSGLVPYLPAEQQHSVLDKALKAAHSIEDEASRVKVLDKLDLYLPVNVLNKTVNVNSSSYLIHHSSVDQRVMREKLRSACSIEDEPHRVYVLCHLAPLLPFDLLDEVLSIAHSEEFADSCTTILSSLAENLAAWSVAVPIPAYRTWKKTLPVLAAQSRPRFLENLAALMPFILALAGDEAPQAAEGIYHAIQEVCEWWL